MKTRGSCQSGQILVLIVIVIVALLAILGLVIDGGFQKSERRRAQNATDSAATAAANDIALGGSNNQATASALDFARRNGYNNDQTTNWVTVNIPPVSGPFQGKSGYAQVQVRKRRTSFIMGVVGQQSGTIAAWSVAGTTPTPGVIVLNPTQSGALQLTSDANVTVQGSVQVNSSSASAAILSSNGGVTTTGGFTNIVGGASVQSGGTFNPAARTGQPPLPDPYANLPVPNISGVPVFPQLVVGGTNVTISPGIYLGGIIMSGSGNLTMQPGVYILAGGGFHVTSNGGVNGSGVMIYNTGQGGTPTIPGAQAFGQIELSSNGSFNLSPPTSGPYAGLTFFQDRMNTQQFVFSSNGGLGGAGGSLSGAIYLRRANFYLSSNGGSLNSNLVVDTLTLSSNGNLNVVPPASNRGRVSLVQ